MHYEYPLIWVKLRLNFRKNVSRVGEVNEKGENPKVLKVKIVLGITPTLVPTKLKSDIIPINLRNYQ